MDSPAIVNVGQPNVSAEIIQRARRERMDSRAALETAKARHRNVGKKIESWGLDLKQLDKAIEISRRDPDDLHDDFAVFIRYCRVLQIPLGTQLTLFDLELPEDSVSVTAAEEDAAWDAGQQGKIAGRNGEPSTNNPHAPGSLAFTAWSEGHRRGATERAEGLVVKRGRPRKEEPQQQAA